jgi:hypothetical protein
MRPHCTIPPCSPPVNMRLGGESDEKDIDVTGLLWLLSNSVTSSSVWPHWDEISRQPFPQRLTFGILVGTRRQKRMQPSACPETIVGYSTDQSGTLTGAAHVKASDSASISRPASGTPLIEMTRICLALHTTMFAPASVGMRWGGGIGRPEQSTRIRRGLSVSHSTTLDCPGGPEPLMMNEWEREITMHEILCPPCPALPREHPVNLCEMPSIVNRKS